MSMVQTVEAAIKEKAPALHKQLAAKGELREYVRDLSDQISSVTVDLTQAQRQREQWDKLGPMECAAKMQMAAGLNREIAMEQVLQFPQDETSPQSPDATTNSDLMT